MVLPELADYTDISKKKKSERLPPSRSWDYAINFKENFIPKDYLIYPIVLAEERILKEFVAETMARHTHTDRNRN